MGNKDPLGRNKALVCGIKLITKVKIPPRDGNHKLRKLSIRFRSRMTRLGKRSKVISKNKIFGKDGGSLEVSQTPIISEE